METHREGLDMSDIYAIANSLREAEAQEASGHRRPHRCEACELRVIRCVSDDRYCDACENTDICDFCMYRYYHASCTRCQEINAGCMCEPEELVFYDHPRQAVLLEALDYVPGLADVR